MKIDAHQHFWKYDPVQYSWIDMAVIKKDFLPKDLAPILERNNIDGCIAVQAAQSEAETEFLLNLAAKHSFIKGVVGWVDLSAKNVKSRLAHFEQNPKFKGIRHTIYDKVGEFLLKSDFQNGIKALAEFNLTFDLLVFEYQLDSAVKLVEKFPEQPFVLDHLAKPQISEGPSQEWIKNIRKLARHKNVYAKLSGILSLSDSNSKKEDIVPFLDVMRNEFGTDRLMFGSDWPVCNVSGNYETALEIVKAYFLDFSEEVKEKIFGGNAAGFYALS